MIKTERLSIRFVKEDDWKALKDIWVDFSQSPYAQYDAPHTIDDIEVKAKAKQWAEVSPKGEHLFYAVCYQDKMIGTIDFHKIDAGYECGYCFHSDYHGKGYARESLVAVLSTLLGDGSDTCIARTALKNLPSVKLLRTIGFEKIGEESVSFYTDAQGNTISFEGGIFAYHLEK